MMNNKKMAEYGKMMGAGKAPAKKVAKKMAPVAKKVAKKMK
jgi:hypothetical protein